jgi:hypothetical protein
MAKVLLVFFVLICFNSSINSQPDSKSKEEQSLKIKQNTDFRDFYGIAWNGNAHDNLMFVKQMGYGYVFYQRGMEKDPLAKDLKFYIETPQYSIYPVPRVIDLTRSYSEKDRILYEKYFAKKGNKPFPDNMATGWFTSPTSFSVEPDYQQQEVIDTLVNRILKYAKSLENKENNFLFGGFAWDVPQLPGDFWDAQQRGGGGHQITLSFWTGGDYVYKPDSVKFDYLTYSDGHAAFYKKLFSMSRKAFPGSKFMIEPYMIWESWFAQIKDRPDAKEITPDMVLQEKEGTEFVNDRRIFDTGIITKEFVGSTTPNRVGEKENRIYAAEAAINGAWFSWFGRFGGTGDMPGFRNVYNLPPRLQLIRRVANWENLNSVPLSSRSWDGTVYKSPLSYIDQNVIYSTHPSTGKIFVVWLTQDGVVQLPEKSKIESVYRTDSLFIETKDGFSDIQVTDKGIMLNNKEGLAKGYIITKKR